MIKIVAVAAGLAGVLGAGSILLALLNNPVWIVFLVFAAIIFIVGKAL